MTNAPRSHQLDCDVEIRKIICFSNAIESLKDRYRRAVRVRGHFPQPAGYRVPSPAPRRHQPAPRSRALPYATDHICFGAPMQQGDIAAEMERARVDFHHLLDNATSAELRAGT